jgi:hypothetical protein
VYRTSVTDVTDDVMSRVGEAMALAQRGDPGSARAAFATLWDEVGPDGDPFHRVAIAHALADLQDDTHDELAWDHRALAAADALTDERAAAGGVQGPVATFYPSLHLNLADDYLRLGDTLLATHHAHQARASLPTLPDDPYRHQIESALTRVEEALSNR